MLRKRLQALTDKDKDYWSFKGNSNREYNHGLFQYPAMMVPQMVRSILEEVRSVRPDIESVWDPFLGSGTILTESMLASLAFSGNDINPLAVLVSLVKKGPFFIDALKEKIVELNSHIGSDKGSAVSIDFPNRDKWFSRDIQIALSKIQRSIRKENSLWARRFFWIALAETVRLTSNSRTSTFKLHIRSQDDIKARTPDPIVIFKKVTARNLVSYEAQAKRLSECHLLVRGHYRKNVKVSLGDIRHIRKQDESDIIITSPPYGDNTTTVPYGQYSYLPLHWIDLHDINASVGGEYLKSTREIDRRSLGGSNQVSKHDMERLVTRSDSFAGFVKTMSGQPRDRVLRVSSYFRDLDDCLAPILKGLHKDGLLVWILGNRKVGGRRVPLDRILEDLLHDHGVTLVCKLRRRIPSKRMASRNNTVATMSSEKILIMRKGS